MTDYNGWTNRETWACNLWITNDQGLYESARERLDDVKSGADLDDDPASWLEAHGAQELGQSLHDWWQELTDPDEGLMDAVTILKMVRDIGDEDKINWSEIAEGLLSE